MIIRNYVKKDWDNICNIFDRAKPDEMRGSCNLKAIKPLKEDDNFIQLFSNSHIFVAEADGNTVGFAGYSGALIAWLMVDPDYYRKGIGRELLKTVLDCVGDKAYLYVAKYNEPAKGMYFSTGFKIVDAFSGRYNGYKAEALCLALKPELYSGKLIDA